MQFLLTAMLCVSPPCAAQDGAVETWLKQQSIPLGAESASESLFPPLESIRVIGLGEATHGQHECFAFKRKVTLELVRDHGFRLVAYEASATAARALDAYVQGSTDDLDAAMRGFGMMIWMVEENRALLRDLRGWNEGAGANDRVELIGIDVQDPKAAGERLHTLLASSLPKLATEARAVASELMEARNAAYGGSTDGIAPAEARAAAFLADISLSFGHLAAARTRADAAEALRSARELVRFPVAPSRPAMRDRGMGHSLLDALAARPEGTKAVVWGHNGHITKGPLRWMGTEDTGCGGYLRAALGDGYYALGVVFGEGEFQSLDRNAEGTWLFRRYRHGPPPADTLGHRFVQAGVQNAVLDLRSAPAEGPVRTWLDGSCSVRSWGGYGVPEDPDDNDARRQGLAWTVLSEDYDGLLFLRQTTSATPVDERRVWK